MGLKYSKSYRSKNKKLFFAATLLISILVVSSYYLYQNFSAKKSDQIIAKFNNQPIYKTEVEAKLRSIFENQFFASNEESQIPEIEKLPKEVLELIVKEVYLEKKIVEKAVEEGFLKDDKVMQKIQEAKNKILYSEYLDKKILSEVSEEKISNKYLELTKEIEGKKEYKIAHILVKDKENAKKILSELKKKKAAKFSDLAKKYSIDSASAKNAGELDYSFEENMVKEIAQILPAMKINQISDVVGTKFGFHIVKLINIRNAQPLQYEEVKENIKNQLMQNEISKIQNDFITDAKIELLIDLVDEAEMKEKSDENNSLNEDKSSPNDQSQENESNEKAEDKERNNKSESKE
jgi:peptidyl-prolyl cis-trans isomerase C